MDGCHGLEMPHHSEIVDGGMVTSNGPVNEAVEIGETYCSPLFFPAETSPEGDGRLDVVVEA